MSAYASQAMKSPKPYDFKKHIPQPVSEDQYTMDIHTNGKVTGTAIDQGQKNVLGSILLSDISNYLKICSKYCEQMQCMYRIIHGNLDQNIITLLETDSAYTDISIKHDPIELIKLLRELCQKGKGIVYAPNTLIHFVVEFMTCKQGYDSITEYYVETIKLNNAVVTIQYGDNWLPSLYKDAMIGYHPETT